MSNIGMIDGHPYSGVVNFVDRRDTKHIVRLLTLYLLRRKKRQSLRLQNLKKIAFKNSENSGQTIQPDVAANQDLRCMQTDYFGAWQQKQMMF